MDTKRGRTSSGLTEKEKNRQKLEEQYLQDAADRGSEYLLQQEDPAAEIFEAGDYDLEKETGETGAKARETSGSYMEKASREMRRLSHSLRKVEDITQQVQTFAIQHPGLLFGGALITGFAITRAMKLSGRGSSFKPEEKVYGPHQTGFRSSSPAEGVVFNE